MALSSGTEELLALERLAMQIRLEIPHNGLHNSRCDNQQPVGIVTKEGSRAPTRLRHLDIQQHWIQEAHKLGTIKTMWVPTTNMVADALTKALVHEKRIPFVNQLQLSPTAPTTDQELASKP